MHYPLSAYQNNALHKYGYGNTTANLTRYRGFGSIEEGVEVHRLHRAGSTLEYWLDAIGWRATPQRQQVEDRRTPGPASFPCYPHRRGYSSETSKPSMPSCVSSLPNRQGFAMWNPLYGPRCHLVALGPSR